MEVYAVLFCLALCSLIVLHSIPDDIDKREDTACPVDEIEGTDT